MQFAGQRTDMDLRPVGEPHNILVKMTEDVLPDPDAVLVTGITPQKTIADGVTEADFLRTFQREIATKDTVFVGFNTVRFDDEFMRYSHYRNFYDPYEWQWKDGRSRWDILDVARMTRALRPEGIQWPYDGKGNPSNRLELLTSVNKLSHDNAHDALGDVRATIAVADLIKTRQPKLFDFLLRMRDKRAAKNLVHNEKMFVYSSGKYSSEQEKTTIAAKIADTPEGAALVYDLSVDPEPFLKMDATQIIEAWQRRHDDPEPKLPVKALKYNRCPAIAPLGVLDEKSQNRLGLDPKRALAFLRRIEKTDFAHKCLEAAKRMNQAREARQSRLLDDDNDVDARLYEGFFSDTDKTAMRRVRAASVDQLREFTKEDFKDTRLQALLPLYKARNFSGALADSERRAWEEFRHQKLMSGGMQSRAARFMKRLQELDGTTTDPEKRYLLEEMQLYAESILPEPDGSSS